jgi:hypothetical protein
VKSVAAAIPGQRSLGGTLENIMESKKRAIGRKLKYQVQSERRIAVEGALKRVLRNPIGENHWLR